MKRNFLVIALLLSIICWGVNTTAFAQTQVKKDTVVHKVKKEVVKKVDVKKEEVKTNVLETKKNVTKTSEVKKDGTKKDVTTTVESKKEVKEVKTVIKDKEIGKTPDGKIIYEGPKGGKYTLSDKGKKVYIKKDVKKEVK